MSDFRRGIDWAKIRASAAQSQVKEALGQRNKLTLASAAGIGAGLAFLAVIAMWAWVYWGLPRVPDANALWAANREASVTFVDRNNEVIGVRGPYYGQRVTLTDLPEFVPQAFLAIEDRRFYEHEGVDRLAVLRAIIANMQAGETVQGGSTISQQLARNLFLTREQTVNRKLREMVLASRIERRLTKDEILELYLNRVYLGEQAYGVDAAARRYFGKSATELTLAQAAMLAGLPKAPSDLNPSSNLEAAKQRQRIVLEAMVAAGFITLEQRDAAFAEEIEVVRTPSRERSMGYVFDIAAAQAHDLIAERDTPDLVIQLTIDPSVQAAAARAIRVRLGNRAFGRRPLQASMMAMDRTGAVRALIGGTDYNTSKFNRVTQAHRQPGSAFKTFVYAAALERGLDTEDVRYDEPVVIDGWRPRNYDEGYRGAVTLRTAFALSLNTVAAEVTDEIGPPRVAEVARRLGVQGMPAENRPAPASIALGSVEVTLWDMTRAFAVFMNDGMEVEPHLIETVRNSAGDQLYRHQASTPRRLMDETIAHHMTSMMGAVVLRGTGAGARLPGRDVAGKTGTSQDYRDAWFIGYTGDYTAGVWLGHDDHTAMARITGGSIPAEIWADTMRVAHEDLPARPLPGIEQPRYTPRQEEMASFFDSLKDAFGVGAPDKEEHNEDDDDNSGFPDIFR